MADLAPCQAWQPLLIQEAFEWGPCFKKADGDGGQCCKEHASVAKNCALAVIAPWGAVGAAADWTVSGRNAHGDLCHSGEQVNFVVALYQLIVAGWVPVGKRDENREKQGHGVPAPADSVNSSLSTQFSLAVSRSLYHSVDQDWYFHPASSTYYDWDDSPKTGAWRCRAPPTTGFAAWS